MSRIAVNRRRHRAFFVLLGAVVSLFSLLCAAAPAQEVSGLQAAVALEEVMVNAIARSEASVVSIARVQNDPDQPAVFTPEMLPRPGMMPFGEQPSTSPSSPDFVPNDFATGVVIDASGLIVTTYHAVMEKGQLWVTTTDKRPMRAEIRGADPRSDLAVLRIVDPVPGIKFKPIAFGDPSKLRKGQIVVALGNPYAIARDGQASASWGIVANLSRKAGPNDTSPSDDARLRKNTLHHFGTLIQTDAKLNLGTSGGALLNLKGEMVGLTTSQAAVSGFEQAAGYAIPCDELFHRVVDALKDGKEVEYGLLGIRLRGLTPGEAAAGRHGVHVDGIVTGTPADRAGILPGDVITQVADTPIDDVDGLMLQVGRQPASAETTVTVERNGQLRRVPVTLAKFEVVGKKVITAPAPAWRGLTIDFPSAHQGLNPQMQMQFEFRTAAPESCVLTVDVQADSPAWNAGLRRGMLISHVDGVSVSTPKEFYQQTATRNGAVELRIAGDPALHSVTVPAK